MAFKKILVATDGSANAQRALNVGIDLARQYGAELIVMHAIMGGPMPEGLLQWARAEHLVETPPEPSPAEDIPAYGRLGTITHDRLMRVPYQARLAVARAIVEDAGDHAKKAGVAKVTPVIEDGDATEVIDHVVKSEAADLVVLGTRGLGTLKGLMVGSVSHKVVGLGHCPCVVVP
ncbi:universal stress protein [Ferruginivarius sediminum]|uniref:Universal stress protein n=1 Tax=Ferruginivarius sediminum TaxID=2661937 RepID=A0A369TCX6_9PROT|nr:universal stress protein [Ferruginivarius sediminum]RDD62245.1 universal stress protein [Ferruginivarius sediminum]